MAAVLNHRAMGEMNRSAILAELLKDAPISRTELARRTGLTTATISRTVQRFLSTGLVQEGAQSLADTPGRRHVELVVNDRAAYFIAVALTARPEISIVSTLNRQIVTSSLTSFEHSTLEHALEHICSTATNLIRSSGLDERRILACGVAATGIVDRDAGLLVRSSTLGWENVAVAQKMMSALAVPVFFEGLSNAFNLAEYRFGKDKTESRSRLLIHASMGIGASLIINGRVVRGKEVGLGEIGNKQFSLVNAAMNLPADATLNQISGGRGVLLRRHQEPRRQTEAMTCSPVIAWERYREELVAVAHGNANARRAFRKSGEALGLSIAPALQVLQPETMAMAGVSCQVPEFLDGFKSAVSKSIPDLSAWCTIKLCGMSRSEAAGWLAIYEALIEQGIEPTASELTT